MAYVNVRLNEAQILELLEHVDITDYVTFMDMTDWNAHMDGKEATEVIDAVDIGDFDTGDEYAVYSDRYGTWSSNDDLSDILEEHIQDMLQEYLDTALL